MHPRRYYTPDLANRSLPLVRAIAHDLRQCALEMEEVWTELHEGEKPSEQRAVELSGQIRSIQSRFECLVQELEQLGIELKDPFQGLLDFRSRRDGRVVHLCWQLGEDKVGHWHEIEAGFRGRQPI